MADEKPGLHIDSDWKKQAQEEKRRLAEQEAKRTAAQPPPAAPTAAAPPSAAGAAPRAAAGRGPRGEMPPASFPGLVQSLVTQTLFYLGDIAPRGSQPMLDLDMAKHQIDTLAMLDEKTRGNLNDEERQLLDAALYEVRMRYVSVASQFIG